MFDILDYDKVWDLTIRHDNGCDEPLVSYQIVEESACLQQLLIKSLIIPIRFSLFVNNALAFQCEHMSPDTVIYHVNCFLKAGDQIRLMGDYHDRLPSEFKLIFIGSSRIAIAEEAMWPVVI